MPTRWSRVGPLLLRRHPVPRAGPMEVEKYLRQREGVRRVRWLPGMVGAALAWLTACALPAPAQGVYPGMIRSGIGGFGFSPAVGTIGYGASYGGYGYVFVPGLGFQPAYSSTHLHLPGY